MVLTIFKKWLSCEFLFVWHCQAYSTFGTIERHWKKYASGIDSASAEFRPHKSCLREIFSRVLEEGNGASAEVCYKNQNRCRSEELTLALSMSPCLLRKKEY